MSVHDDDTYTASTARRRASCDRADDRRVSNESGSRRTAGRPAWISTVARCAIAFAVLSISMLLVGWIGQLLVFDTAIGDAETDLVAWLADNRIGAIDTAMTVGSALTDTWTVIGVLFGAVVILLATGNRRFAGTMAIAMGLELAVFAVVGPIIDRSRPDVEALHSVPSTPSFPSGHVAAAVVLYGSLTFIARSLSSTRVRATVWVAPTIAVVAVVSSRLYEGVHYPTDVAGGVLLGLGALYGAAFASEPFAPETVVSKAPFGPSTPRHDSGSGV